jgi:hypothetical protein
LFLHCFLASASKGLGPLLTSIISYQEPFRRYVDAQIDVKDKSYDRNFNPVGGVAAGAFAAEANLDATARQYRETTKFGGPAPEFPGRAAEVRITQERTSRSTVDGPRGKRDMGYYDNDGQYHSFRRGAQRFGERVAERIAHPVHGPSIFRHHHHHDHHPSSEEVERREITVEERDISIPRGASHGYSRESHGHGHGHVSGHGHGSHKMSHNTITIPCHHIRIGDLLILQGRPCQVIRITTSAQTGQHRYLGVDLFTKQLHEESSFISNPAPSVIVQNMLGPVFKQYRVLDIRDDGCVVAMTETGDVKQALPVLDQSELFGRLSGSFDSGRGSVRVLVLSDEGRELVVDYKTVHGSRL